MPSVTKVARPSPRWRQGIHAKLIASYTSIGLATALMSFLAIEQGKKSRQSETFDSAALMVAMALRAANNAASQELIGYVVSGDTEELDAFRAQSAEFDRRVREFRIAASVGDEDPIERDLLAVVVANAHPRSIDDAERLRDLIAHGQLLSAEGFHAFERPLDAEDEAIGELVVREQLELDEAHDRETAAMRATDRIVLISAGIAVLIAVLMGTFFGRRLTRPLSALRDAAAALGAGDLDVRIPNGAQDEIGDLARSFQTMAGDLKALQGARDRQQQKRLEDIFGSMSEILIVFSPAGLITAVNYAACATLGYPEAGLLGQPASLILAAPFDEVWRSVASPAVSPDDRTLRACDGHLVPVRLSLTYLHDADARPDGLVCVAKDLTERKDLEERLRQADKLSAIGQLAAGISHEVNNPLGVILGFAQGMERRLKDQDPMRTPVTAIVRESLRCKALVQELLTFARTEKKHTEPVDLNSLVRSSGILLQARIKSHAHQLILDLNEQIPVVQANRTQLQQVLVNLATNSLDAMNDGGVLTLRTRAGDPGEIVLEVADDGTGIPEEIREKIWNPFFTTKEPGKGTGLGLSLVYEIVRQHGGHVNVLSQPGHGTCMSVAIPVGRA